MKARKVQESAIMHAPPHVREIWDLFLCKACHSGNKYLSRGQLRITYNEIRESLHWMIGWRKMQYSKWDCEKALKWLRKATMITTKKTTLGTVVTICNYGFYQNPANYEGHTTLPPKATGKPQTTDTIYKKVKNVKNDKKFKPPTLEEVIKYVKEKGYQVDVKKFMEYYTESDWHDKDGKSVRNWKQKIIAVWNKPGSQKPCRISGCKGYPVYTSTDDTGQVCWWCEAHKPQTETSLPTELLNSLKDVPQGDNRSASDKSNELKNKLGVK